MNELIQSSCISEGHKFIFIVSRKINSRLQTIKPMLMWQWQGWIPRSMREYKSSIGMYWFLYEAMFNHDGDTSLYITYQRRPNTLESQMHFHTCFHQVTTICSVRQDLFFYFYFLCQCHIDGRCGHVMSQFILAVTEILDSGQRFRLHNWALYQIIKHIDIIASAYYGFISIWGPWR